MQTEICNYNLSHSNQIILPFAYTITTTSCAVHSTFIRLSSHIVQLLLFVTVAIVFCVSDPFNAFLLLNCDWELVGNFILVYISDMDLVQDDYKHAVDVYFKMYNLV